MFDRLEEIRAKLANLKEDKRSAIWCHFNETPAQSDTLKSIKKLGKLMNVTESKNKDHGGS